MSAFHTGPMLGASLRRWMPSFVVASTPPAEVGPSLVSPPSLSASVARVGVPLGYVPGVYSAGDPIETLVQWLIDGAPVPGATGSTYTPALADSGKHVAIQEVATTGYGEDAVGESMALQVQAAIATAVPAAPTAVDAVPGSAGQIVVTWALPTSAADGSPVGTLTTLTLRHGATEGQQIPGGTGTVAVAVGAAAITYTITGLSAGVRYISVSASNAVGEGWTSPEVSATAT